MDKEEFLRNVAAYSVDRAVPLLTGLSCRKASSAERHVYRSLSRLRLHGLDGPEQETASWRGVIKREWTVRCKTENTATENKD